MKKTTYSRSLNLIVLMVFACSMSLLLACSSNVSDAAKYESLDAVKEFLSLEISDGSDAYAKAYVELGAQTNIPESMQKAHEYLCDYAEYQVKLATMFEFLEKARKSGDTKSFLEINDEIEVMNKESATLYGKYCEERNNHRDLSDYNK